jgi:threonine dehydratase
MRFVAATAAAEPVRWRMPDRAKLDAMRHLDARFPGARLRQVPVVRASELDARADPTGATRVWLALEALQVTGTFRVRGALVSLDANRPRGHVVAASAGNRGVAIAYAANVLGLSATICVPRTAARSKRAKIENYGAELVVAAGDRYEDAEGLARATAAAREGDFISQYDDADVVAGNGSSLGFEIVRALGGLPERVLSPYGCGSLATGLAWALTMEGNGASERAVWGVRSTPSRLRATSIEVLPRSEGTIAGVMVATEAQVDAAMVHAYRDMGLVVESSGVAALVPVLAGLPKEVRGGDVVVVLTGRNVDPERLEALVRAADNSLPL